MEIKDVDMLKKIFEELDVTKDGYIDRNELRPALAKAVPRPTALSRSLLCSGATCDPRVLCVRAADVCVESVGVRCVLAHILGRHPSRIPLAQHKDITEERSEEIFKCAAPPLPAASPGLHFWPLSFACRFGAALWHARDENSNRRYGRRNGRGSARAPQPDRPCRQVSRQGRQQPARLQGVPEGLPQGG